MSQHPDNPGAYREKLRLSQAEVAHKLGVRRSIIRDYERSVGSRSDIARLFFRLLEHNPEQLMQLVEALPESRWRKVGR